MYQAILAAEKSIYFEVYIFIDDTAGERFVRALCDKAAAGVEVKLIFDSVGSFSLSRAALQRLNRAGVKVVWYNRVRPGWHVPRWFFRVWYRNHRKFLIVDEEIVFLGGVNIYQEAALWNDVHLRLEGMPMRILLGIFGRSYIKAGGDKKDVAHLLALPAFKIDLAEWRKKIDFIFHSPLDHGGRKKFMRQIYVDALRSSKHSFTMLSPYYIPDKRFIEAIKGAVARGVKVEILLPQKTDYRIMQVTAKSFFNLTCRAGAVLYLLKTMNHGKAFCVDGASGFVGSANLTPRSFRFNEESNVYFNDVAMVKDLQAIFEGLKKEAVMVCEYQETSWFLRTVAWFTARVDHIM